MPRSCFRGWTETRFAAPAQLVDRIGSGLRASRHLSERRSELPGHRRERAARLASRYCAVDPLCQPHRQLPQRDGHKSRRLQQRPGGRLNTYCGYYRPWRRLSRLLGLPALGEIDNLSAGPTLRKPYPAVVRTKSTPRPLSDVLTVTEVTCTSYFCHR
jgi:hypothetical protein